MLLHLHLELGNTQYEDEWYQIILYKLQFKVFLEQC